MATKRKPATKTRAARKKQTAKLVNFEEMRQFIELFNVLLTSEVVDETRSIPGSDPVYKPAYEEHERLTIKSKMFYILNLLPGQ